MWTLSDHSENCCGADRWQPQLQPAEDVPSPISLGGEFPPPAQQSQFIQHSSSHPVCRLLLPLVPHFGLAVATKLTLAVAGSQFTVWQLDWMIEAHLNHTWKAI